MPRACASAHLWRVQDLTAYLEGQRRASSSDAEGCEMQAGEYAQLDRRAEHSLAAAAALFAEHDDLHLAACSAGAVSPLHVAQVALSDAPTLPKFARLTPAGGVEIGEADTPDAIPAEDLFSPAHFDSDVVAADGEERFARDSEYIYHVRNRAGEVISEESFARQRAMRAEMEAQGMEIALDLQAAGVPAFDKSVQRRAPMIVDPIGRQVLRIVPFRRVNFNPVCAAARRSPMLKHLEDFLAAHPRAMMGTFTHGERVSLSGPGVLREEISHFHRDLSKLAAAPDLKPFKFRMHFRATEGGTLLRACRWPRRVLPYAPDLSGMVPDDPGEVWIHIHAHVFFDFGRRLETHDDRQARLIVAALLLLEAAAAAETPKRARRAAARVGAWLLSVGVHHCQGEFAMFARRVWKLWGRHWDYGRTIADAREACKYPVKPADYKAARFRPAETRRLFEELRGMRLVTPMGALKPKIRLRRDLALKGIKRRGADGVLSLRFRPDWNARGQRARMIDVTRPAIADVELCLAARAGGMYVPAVSLLVDAQQNSAAIAAAERRQALARFEAASSLLDAAAQASRFSFASAGVSAARWLARWLALDCPPNDAETARAARRKQKELKRALSPALPVQNQIVARLAPAPYFDRVTRPALLVWNFDGNFDALAAQHVCKELISAAAPRIAAGLQDLESERRLAALGSIQSPHHSHNCPNFSHGFSDHEKGDEGLIFGHLSGVSQGGCK